MTQISQSVEVGVPVRVAYDQWTQFEEFPRFMDGVDTVRQTTDRTMTWSTSIAGQGRDFNVEITEQRPDERITWSTTAGLDHQGVVTFQPIDDNRSRVAVRIDYEPEGMGENLAARTGLVDSRVKGDLENFKHYIEQRGEASGAYRESIN